MSNNFYDPRTRFRVYRVRQGKPEEVAGCPTYGGIGLMLVTLHEDGEFDAGEAVGVMDTGPRERGEGATWLISPFAGRGRSA